MMVGLPLGARGRDRYAVEYAIVLVRRPIRLGAGRTIRLLSRVVEPS